LLEIQNTMNPKKSNALDPNREPFGTTTNPTSFAKPSSKVSILGLRVRAKHLGFRV
jgi:hypothetical protein